MSTEIMTPPEVARRLRVAPETVVSWIRSGQLDGFDVAQPGTRRPRFRITEDALDRFMRLRSTRPKTRSSGRPTTRKKPEHKDYFPDLK